MTKINNKHYGYLILTLTKMKYFHNSCLPQHCVIKILKEIQLVAYYQPIRKNDYKGRTHSKATNLQILLPACLSSIVYLYILIDV
jgi:hypothetical protein